jgi:hypothetical protein
MRRLIVTGHPNHELAIFGFAQRMRPHLLFLTDGGGEARENESRAGLRSIGLIDRARFLGWTEQSLYDALLDVDVATLQRLVAAVRGEIMAVRPRQVICESIELYNPLHDLTLPVVRAAAAGLDVEILEFALIAQEPGPAERYRVQRFPATREVTTFALDAAELATKLHARDHVYHSLRQTMSPVLERVPSAESAVEHFAHAAGALPEPGVDHVLRYEWRGRLLHQQGRVERVITFEGHFAKAVAGLR